MIREGNEHFLGHAYFFKGNQMFYHFFLKALITKRHKEREGERTKEIKVLKTEIIREEGLRR
jgi:hypothetical protein